MARVGTTQVQKFYQGTGVFVTGGTGFLGKLTIEKILRSCPDVKTVYVLIRSKKGLTTEERKKIMLDNVVFDRMKSEQPDCVEKIVFVSGDCSEPRLGLSDYDYHDLTQHVNIVLHLAATVRFDENLKVAINVNVKGALEVVNLCWQCASLKAAVFVSTAYCHAYLSVLEEVFYEPPMRLEEILAIQDRVTERELEILSHKLTGPWKMPYLFSKAIIENVILTKAKGLPVSIVRPSMVVSTMKDPLPGWVDNMYGPISITVGIGSGVLRVNNTYKNMKLDLIPADIVVNCVITAALASNTRSSAAIPIYNVTTSYTNALTTTFMEETLLRHVREFPLNKTIWHPTLTVVKNFKLYTILILLLHVLPGYLIDIALKIKGSEPMLIKIYRKIHMYTKFIGQYPTLEPLLVSKNAPKLYEELDSADKELFFFDTTQIRWKDYLENASAESRKYLLNDTLDNIEENRSRGRKLYILHVVVKYIFCILAMWITWRILMSFMSHIF